MSNLKLAMDSAFWDQSLSSSITLDGIARSIPGEPFPLDGAKASRGIRAQQLSFLGNGFPLGIIPCYSPTSHKELGPFSVQSFFKRKSSNWWLGLIGQIRPQNVLSSLKQVQLPKMPKMPTLPKLPEILPLEEWESSMFIDFAKVAWQHASQQSIYIDFAKRAVNAVKAVDNAVDRSRYSLNLCAQFTLNEASSLFLSTEGHGDREGRRRSKALFFHKLPDHDLTVEAATPELFVDRNGRYWDVPGAISLDLASLASESGLRYRVGIHSNIGQPQVLNATSGEPPSAQALNPTAGETPLALLPGLCAKAAFSYERSMDIWRQKEPEVDSETDSDDDEYWCPSYDVRLREPHAAISGIVGGTCAAWVGGRKALVSSSRKRSPLSADLYGSACYTYQHGKFEKLFGDFSRVDARLDICSAFAFTKGAAHLVANVFGRSSKEVNPLASPRLNVALQQQIAGPIVFRVDSKLALGSTSLEKRGPHIEDVIYSLCYSMRFLRSGQVVAWYSPKRKEGMVEVRLFEF